MRELITMMKALADGNRLRVIGALQGHELYLCQIAELLGLAPSTASQHMAILQRAGLVESQKLGRWARFRLAGDDAASETREASALVSRAMARDPRAREDTRRVKQIVSVDPEELCRHRNKCQCAKRTVGVNEP